MDMVANMLPPMIDHQANVLSRNSAESAMSPMKNASNATKSITAPMMRNHSAMVPAPISPVVKTLPEQFVSTEGGPPRYRSGLAGESQKSHEGQAGNEVAHQDGRPTELTNHIDPSRCDARVEHEIEEAEAEDQP